MTARQAKDLLNALTRGHHQMQRRRHRASFVVVGEPLPAQAKFDDGEEALAGLQRGRIRRNARNGIDLNVPFSDHLAASVVVSGLYAEGIRTAYVSPNVVRHFDASPHMDIREVGDDRLWLYGLCCPIGAESGGRIVLSFEKDSLGLVPGDFACLLEVIDICLEQAAHRYVGATLLMLHARKTVRRLRTGNDRGNVFLAKAGLSVGGLSVG